MSSIVRKFNRFDTRRRTGTHSYGSEACANTLRQEYGEIERDTERYVGQARQLIERERIREGER